MLPALIRLICTLSAAYRLLCPAPDVQLNLLRSGEALRFHVVAHDDSPQMQHVKLCVRDAVHQRYLTCGGGENMLIRASELLPQLTQAAVNAAKAEGFNAPVAVSLGRAPFDERMLGGRRIPAGEYPALIIRLGDGQGQNWWGLLDPELSALWAASDTEESGSICWDWSLSGLMSAIRRFLGTVCRGT